MSRILWATALSVFCCLKVTAQEKKPKKADQRREEIKLLAKEMRGEANKKLDGTTVDIVTDELAISVTWGTPNAWEAALGRSLHHALVLEKRPAVVLLRLPDDGALVERCCQVCRAVGIQVILRDTTTHKSTVGYTPSAGELLAIRRPGKHADELFELHVRVRRTTGGVDLLLATTVPIANGAAAAAHRINQVRDYGMIGLTALRLIVKTSPETNRALQSTVQSIRAEASGARLVLTASIPDEAAKAVADLVDAAIQAAKRLLGQ
jgi:hypothetical protein